MKLSYILLFFLFLILFKLPAQDTCSKYEQMSFVYAELNDSTASKYLDSLNGCSGSEATLFSRANILFKDGKYEEALVLFEKYINDNEKGESQRSEACIYAGICAHNIKQYDNALKYYKWANKLGFYSVIVYHNMGITYDAMGDYVSAANAYFKSLEFDSLYANSWNNLGVIHEKQKKLRESHNYFAIAYNLNADIDPLLMVNYAKALFKVQKYDSAILVYDRVLAKHPLYYRADILLAEIYNWYSKHPEKALKHARKGIVAAPDDRDANFEYAAALDDIGQKDSALFYYSIVLHIDSTSCAAYGNSATVYELYGYFDKAIEYFQKALSICPWMENAVHGLSNTYLYKYDFENALKYNLVLYKMGSNPQVKALSLGYVYLQMGDTKNALKYLKESLIGRTAQFDVPYNNMGLAFLKSNQLDSAKKYLDMAHAINPDNSFIYHNRALYYYKINDYEKACSDLKKSIELEYNWIIDSSLQKLATEHCKNVSLNRIINFHGYKGNLPEFSDKKFISVIDSLSLNHLHTTIKTIVPTPEGILETGVKLSGFSIYPNPNRNSFIVSSPVLSKEKYIMDIYNANGQKIFSKELPDNSEEVELSNLPSGLYVAVILQNNNVVHTEKIIIQQ